MNSLWGIAFSIALVSCSTSSEVLSPTNRTTIDPTPTDLVVYRDVTNKFELTYSQSDFQIDAYEYPRVAVGFLLNLESNFPGKNLEEVRVNIALNPECHFLKVYGATALVESATINGNSFKKVSISDSGSGSNIFETITYQTTRNDNCYEIHTNIREYRLDMFPNLTEYSRTFLDTELESLIKTFRFLE